MTTAIRVRTRQREELRDIGPDIREALRASGIRDGVLHLWCMHTTCALTVNEGADPDVASDMVAFMRRLVPRDAGFDHAEGNSDAHVKVSLFGPGLTLLVENGEPVLGTWQKVFLAEWDGPREREIRMLVHPTN